MHKRKSDTPVISYPPEAVLELHHVADWLRVGESMVERLDIPGVFLGTRTKRYLAKDVLAFLEQRKSA